ncbi:MAG TPA: helix-turn-helix domain-containing protein [Bryobacteraceae bacterium]|nr:helix-turn-helix domain-containing protein [Bryobacteraceae bacterium]
MPVIVMVAADPNEHSHPTKPVRTKPLKMPFISRSILCPRGEYLGPLTTSLQRDQSYGAACMLLAAHPKGMVVGKIQAKLGITPSTLSHHLDKLRHEGLVSVKRDSKYL